MSPRLLGTRFETINCISEPGLQETNRDLGLTSQCGRGPICPPEKYSTLDAGRFRRYKWAYPMSQLFCEEVALSILGGDFECILDRVSLYS
jgi:hypothetical protein